MARRKKLYSDGNFLFESYVDAINKDIDKYETERRKKAVQYLAKKLRQKIKNQYGKGNLYKGVAHVTYDKLSKVGYTKPAQHAHLIEFGTDRRFVMNYKGKKNNQKDVSYMKPNPILKNTINEESPMVEKILASGWLE